MSPPSALIVQPAAETAAVPVTKSVNKLGYNSTWKTNTPLRLTRESFLDILDNKIAVIREPQYLTPDVSQKLDDVLTPKLTPYTHNTGPVLKKVGVAQFEFQAQAEEDLVDRTKTDKKEDYFRAVEAVSHIHGDPKKGIKGEVEEICGVDVLNKIISQIAELVPEYDVMVANEGEGKGYYSGIFRAINESTPIHCDWSPYDSRTEDWIVNKITKQAVFNLYLVPVKGGKTIVHDKQWDEECLNHRDPASYGYFPAVVEGRDSCTIIPGQGDLGFFNTRNMHEVFSVDPETHPVHGEGWRRPRLTMSSFIGYLPPQKEGERPKLIFWS